MKSIIIIFLFAISFSYGQENSNYTISINGEKYDYSLDEDFEYDVKKKGKLIINISQKDILTYNDGVVTFTHTKNFPVSETPVEEGIKQISVIGSDGSGIIIQEYSDFDPTLMIDLMLNEVTKESKEYGYTETSSDVEIKIKGGKLLKGKKSTLEYQGIIDEWIVVSYSWKDSGLIFISMKIDKNSIDDSGVTNVEDFFNSLEILK